MSLSSFRRSRPIRPRLCMPMRHCCSSSGPSRYRCSMSPLRTDSAPSPLLLSRTSPCYLKRLPAIHHLAHSMPPLPPHPHTHSLTTRRTMRGRRRRALALSRPEAHRHRLMLAACPMPRLLPVTMRAVVVAVIVTRGHRCASRPCLCFRHHLPLWALLSSSFFLWLSLHCSPLH